MRQNFRKNKVVIGKTPFAHSLASDREVLYGNDAFSILVLSTKKRYFPVF